MLTQGATRAGSNPLSNRDDAWFDFPPRAKSGPCYVTFDGIRYFPFAKVKTRARANRDMGRFARAVAARIERSNAVNVSFVGNVAGHDFN